MNYFCYLLIIAGLAIQFGCGPNNQKNSHSSGPPLVTKPVENIVATKDQKERRASSEAFCKAHKIPVYSNPNSLFVDPAEEIAIRSKDEIINRALALCYIGLKSEGLEQNHLDQLEKKFHVSSMLTPEEKAFVSSAAPTEQQKIDAGWKYEGLHVMLWALGYVDSLNYPDRMCDVVKDVKIIHDLTAQQFRDKAKLRSKEEILDQADLILRLDWACDNARLSNKPAPGNLDAGVVFERHHSLNWLINYMNEDWDNVSTDT